MADTLEWTKNALNLGLSCEQDSKWLEKYEPYENFAPVKTAANIDHTIYIDFRLYIGRKQRCRLDAPKENTCRRAEKCQSDNF
jgi:hypothetical protein